MTGALLRLAPAVRQQIAGASPDRRAKNIRPFPSGMGAWRHRTGRAEDGGRRGFAGRNLGAAPARTTTPARMSRSGPARTGSPGGPRELAVPRPPAPGEPGVRLPDVDRKHYRRSRHAPRLVE